MQCGIIPVSPDDSLLPTCGCKRLCCGQLGTGGAASSGGLSACDVDVGNHIIGFEDVKRTPIPLKSPRELTPTEWEQHMITHLPQCPGCPYCTAGKKPNQHHRRSTTSRQRPHITADYGFLRDSTSDSEVPFLVVYTQPFKILLR